MTSLDWWFDAIRSTEPPHIQCARRATGRKNVPARVAEMIDRMRREQGLPPLYETERKIA